jgi:ribosome-associated protein
MSLSDDDARSRALTLARAALEGQAEELVLLHIGELSLLADYFLVASGNSDRHVRALADRIEEVGREAKIRPLHREGEREARWILLDYGDVVVHLFEPETRAYYNLVGLWADAPRVEVEVDAAV